MKEFGACMVMHIYVHKWITSIYNIVTIV